LHLGDEGPQVWVEEGGASDSRGGERGLRFKGRREGPQIQGEERGASDSRGRGRGLRFKGRRGLRFEERREGPQIRGEEGGWGFTFAFKRGALHSRGGPYILNDF